MENKTAFNLELKVAMVDKTITGNTFYKKVVRK